MEVVYLQHCSFVTMLVPCEAAAVSAHSVYTIQSCTLPCHFMQNHIGVHACLAATCHLHFCQNDCDLLHATVVTWGWKGYRNNSQHRKFTLEKKILLPLLPGFKPTTFQSPVQRSNHQAIPTPLLVVYVKSLPFINI